jgi:glucosamine-6-phosphate deaminase
MKITVTKTRRESGKEAAEFGAELIRQAIARNGSANLIMATGASQFDMLEHLATLPVNWKHTNCFHLDEYIGLPMSHGASFRKYLKERFVDEVHPGTFNYINGEADPEKECKRLGALISKVSIDVAFVGIGENAHLAFNDPPADFQVEDPYLVVTLDEACRRQQLNEGWFDSFESVPQQAISMSVKQILKSKYIIAVVPDKRKASAVQLTVNSKIDPMVPASILRTHDNTTLFLDEAAASLIEVTDEYKK